MSGFSATLNQLCAGTASLDAALAAFHGEPLGDWDALLQQSMLIESAWRAGKLDRNSYETLRKAAVARRSAVEAPRKNDSLAAAAPDAIFPSWSPQPGSMRTADEIRAERGDVREGSTRLRTTGSSGPTARTPFASVRPQPTDPRSQPSAASGSFGQITNPSEWSYGAPQSVGPGTVLKERFVLEEVIGRGGMGTIYRARDLRKEEAQDRHPYVAVKVLNEDFRRHPEALKALQRESRKAQALAHPNVASVFDFDRDGPLVFLVMELLEGVSLDQFIKSRVGRPLPHGEAMRIVQALCAALAHAHQKDLVHADFKPANAFRTQDGSVKVLDFGIARAIGRRTQESDQTLFDPASLGALTPCYASPEMLVGDPPDPRDDVYALACVSYELFCSRHPFNFTSSLLAERRGMKPAPIPGLDRHIWRALLHGLAFSRANRTPSVEAFLSEIAPARRSWIGATAAAVVAAITIGVVSWFVAIDSTQERANLDAAPQVDAPLPDTSQVTEPVAEVKQEKPQEKPQAPVTLAVAPVQPPKREPVPVVARPSTRAPAAAEASTVAPNAVPDSGPALAKRKERLLSLAAVNDLPEALTLLHGLKRELAADDAFITADAPVALAQSYIRLSTRAFETGEFESAAALLTRAAEFSPDDPWIAARREPMDRLAHIAHTLDNVLAISADAVNAELEPIQLSEAQRYPVIRTQLAEILARRITELQSTAPQRANQLLKVGRQVFAGNTAIENLQPVDETAGVAMVQQAPVEVREEPETDAAVVKPE